MVDIHQHYHDEQILHHGLGHFDHIGIMVGILAKVSSICAENDVNITEVTQSILQDMFCMIMMADITNCSIEFSEFSDILAEYGKNNGLSIHVMNEDIFNSMHRI